MIWIDKFKSAFEKIVSPVVESPVSEVLVEETESLFESSLSRLYSKYNNHAVGAITGFRGTRTRAENKSINSKLLAYLLSKGYSVTKVKGAYVENFGSDDAKEVGEESFFVANAKVSGDDKGQLETDLVNLGKMFDQDSILIVPYGGKGTLVGTSNRDNAFPSLGDRVEVGSAKFGGPVGQFYSRVKGRKFAFEEMVRIKEPETIAGKRAMIIMAESVEMELTEAKPNRVFANLAKNPFEPAGQFRKESEAEAKKEELKAEGYDAKITSMKLGPKKKPWTVYNVWKRENNK